MNINKIQLVVITVGVVLLTAGFLFFMNKNKQDSAFDTLSKSEELSNTGIRLLRENKDGSVDKLEEALSVSDSANQEARIKINLAFGHYAAGSVDRGLTLLKEVSLNEEYPPISRAWAINYILSSYLADLNNTEYAQDKIFTGEQWEDFLQEGGNHSTAIRKGFEWSTTLHSTPTAENWIALWYASRLYTDLNTETHKKYAELARERLLRGESATELVEFGAVKSSFADRAVGYQNKALALAALYQNNELPDILPVEEAFLKSIEIFDNDTYYASRTFVLMTRYLFAGFLAAENPERKIFIRSILDPMFDSEAGNLNSFLTSVNEGLELLPDHKLIAISIAQIDPRFKDMLIGLGWDENLF